MKALYFDSKKLRLIDTRPPSPGPGEALIRVTLAGICATDLEIMRGYMNFRGIPGHEFVGVVEAPERSPLFGKRVVGEINIPCGDCDICTAGLGKHCPRRTVLGIEGKNGAFAEYLTLPLENLHEVPSGISDEEAVFVEPLAAAGEFLEREKIDADERVLIIGDGRLAALTAQVVKTKTEKVTVVGVSDTKLSFFRGMGFQTFNISASRPVDTKKAAGGTSGNRALEKYNLPDERFDTAIECSGSPEGLPIAAHLVSPRGRIILKSTYHGEIGCNLSGIVVNEISIIGSRCGSFEAAIELMEKGRLELAPLVSGIYPLDRWREAFRKAASGESFKVVLKLR